ncbi:MAG: Eco47II family restriction endonuclease [Ferruginibacter sp.]|nr:Eco47II family restriction endonuclease [Ferruginibacter sp.]
MPRLNWISDEDLRNAVGSLLATAQEAQRLAVDEFGRNVVDPFSAIFEMAGFNMDFDTWLKSEQARQAQKTLQNFIGGFHQIVLGHCPGWTNMNVGGLIDLLHTDKKIIAEVKNKHNTVSGGKLSGVYSGLENLVMDKASIYKGYTAYFVQIIPPSTDRYNRPFTPSDPEKGQRQPENELIRIIDGANFYALATGSETAIYDLHDAVPDFIQELTGTKLDKERLKGILTMAYG